MKVHPFTEDVIDKMPAISNAIEISVMINDASPDPVNAEESDIGPLDQPHQPLISPTAIATPLH